MKTQPILLYILIPVLALFIYLQVFYADYAYLDEIHQLWHNNDQSNFEMFHTQGRWLTGLLFQKVFSSINNIEQLKLFRIFSLFGWILTGLLWCLLFKRWIDILNIDQHVWWIGSIYVICSLSVAIFIGWASCMEVFLGVATALLSGHILLMHSAGVKWRVKYSFLPVGFAIVLGVVSLFIYQNAFGVCLLPFFFYYVQRKRALPDKLLIKGVVYYLLTYVVYYALFQYSLYAYGMQANERTELKINILNKISFFFAGPLPQGFSMNMLFSASSIFSQILYPLVIVIWLVTVFKRNKENTVLQNISFIIVIMILLALIYLPSMIARENFPSYRTLFAFNLAVFIMVIESWLYFFKTPKSKNYFTLIAVLYLIVTGAYAFNIQFIKPLKKEYKALTTFMQRNYSPAKIQVYFIRADKYLFTKTYGTKVYRDEFGAPSTYRDWVPEPMVKQLIYELTNSREAAEKTVVNQFENIDLFHEPINKPEHTLIIDMNKVFMDQNKN